MRRFRDRGVIVRQVRPRSAGSLPELNRQPSFDRRRLGDFFEQETDGNENRTRR